MLHEQILESRGITAVVGAGSAMVILEPEDFEPACVEPDAPIMEYFDWLAGCDDAELMQLGHEHEVLIMSEYTLPLSPQMRELIGSAVWQKI